MVNNVRAIKETKEYMELELNHAIILKINKSHNNRSISMSYDFNPKLLTALEAKEIIDYFVMSQESGIL